MNDPTTSTDLKEHKRSVPRRGARVEQHGRDPGGPSGLDDLQIVSAGSRARTGRQDVASDARTDFVLAARSRCMDHDTRRARRRGATPKLCPARTGRSRPFAPRSRKRVGIRHKVASPHRPGAAASGTLLHAHRFTSLFMALFRLAPACSTCGSPLTPHTTRETCICPFCGSENAAPNADETAS